MVRASLGKAGGDFNRRKTSVINAAYPMYGLKVKDLMAMVGSTVVQQAGLSVMNVQKGVLPHGWLEYADEASGRPYFYNVHTKVTTWYKPTGAVPPPPPKPEEEEEEEAHGVTLDCALDTHNIAMSGNI